ncbi:MAG: glycosyltransferase family 2 protein [Planctomycetota bacterium]
MSTATQNNLRSDEAAAPLKLADQGSRHVSLIIPTFREAQALPHLIARLRAFQEASGYELQTLIMDDPSGDDSDAIVADADLPWLHYIGRTGPRGLSAAVVDGLQRVEQPFVVVMDADLSHPPEAIPELLDALDQGHDFVFGSRYVKGGSTDDDWGLGRWLNSRIATLLARPLTHLKDPMAGFFAFRKQLLDQADHLNPIGYKIGLEILVKAHCTRPGEVPIHFTDRVHGESKLSFKEQLKYIQHLRRLYIFKFGTWTHLIQFLAVGTLGLGVNLAALTGLLAMGVPEIPAIAGGIAVSIVSNFLLNRRFTFSYARDSSWLRQFLGFCGACAIGASVQFAVAASLVHTYPDFIPQVAATLGVIAGTAFNFIANRYLVFKKRHIRIQNEPESPSA